MAGFIQNLLKDTAGAFFGSDYLRDYTHASKTFRTTSYQNAPKLKFLFHVYFEINQEAYSQNVGTGSNFGLLVKSVKLPSFTFDTQILNQYNRKRIIQTKIKYDPIEINFHDDNGSAINTPNAGGMIRNLWKAYYTYYYADGKNPKVAFSGVRNGASAGQVAGGGTTAQPTLADYNTRTQYNPSITGNNSWGYVGESSSSGDKKIPFFKNITIFGFNQKNFVAYTLINPIITRMSHDTYAYEQSNGTMEMGMSIDYETVVYNEGANANKLGMGFANNETYDTTLSPIAKLGSQAKILGQGGLMDTAGSVLSDIGDGNYLSAIQKAGTAYNTFKNVNLKTLAKTELLTGLQNSITQTPNVNRNTGFDIPGPVGVTPSSTGTAGSTTQGAASRPTTVGVNNNAGRQK